MGFPVMALEEYTCAWFAPKTFSVLFFKTSILLWMVSDSILFENGSVTEVTVEMSKGKGKQADKGRKGSPAQGASITLAKINTLHKKLRSSIVADFKASFETLATKLENIQSRVIDLHIGNIEYGTTELSQQLDQLEATCSMLQKDNEWLKAKVSDLESHSWLQNI